MDKAGKGFNLTLAWEAICGCFYLDVSPTEVCLLSLQTFEVRVRRPWHPRRAESAFALAVSVHPEEPSVSSTALSSLLCGGDGGDDGDGDRVATLAQARVARTMRAQLGPATCEYSAEQAAVSAVVVLEATAADSHWKRLVRGVLRLRHVRRLWGILGRWLGEVKRCGVCSS